MIVKPTVKDLLDYAENRYALVIATSKRARQIADGDEKLTDVTDKSPVTIAANEIVEGKVAIDEYESKALERQKKLAEEKNEELNQEEIVEDSEESNSKNNEQEDMNLENE